jgi:hypothetical protein
MTPRHFPRAKYLAGLRAALLKSGVIVDARRDGPSPHDQLVGAFVKELRAAGHEVEVPGGEKEEKTIH